MYNQGSVGTEIEEVQQEEEDVTSEAGLLSLSVDTVLS